MPTDPDRFVTRFPASFVYFVEHYNAHGVMRFRGLGEGSNALMNSWIEDTTYVSDMTKMTFTQFNKTLYLGEIDPWFYCRGDTLGIVSFFELVIQTLKKRVSAPIPVEVVPSKESEDEVTKKCKSNTETVLITMQNNMGDEFRQDFFFRQDLQYLVEWALIKGTVLEKKFDSKRFLAFGVDMSWPEKASEESKAI